MKFISGGVILSMLLPLSSMGFADPVSLNPEHIGQDLPEVGSSLFDKMFRKKSDKGIVYDIPYPFEAFIARLNGKGSAAIDLDSIDPGSFFMDDSSFDLAPALDFAKLGPSSTKLAAVVRAFRKRDVFHQKRIARLFSLKPEQRRMVLAHEFNNLLLKAQLDYQADANIWESAKASMSDLRRLGSETKILFQGSRVLLPLAGKYKITGKYISDPGERKLLVALGRNEAKQDPEVLETLIRAGDINESHKVISVASRRGLQLSETELAIADFISPSSGFFINDEAVRSLPTAVLQKRLDEIRGQALLFRSAVGDQSFVTELSLLGLFKELSEQNSEDIFFNTLQFGGDINEACVSILQQKWMAQIAAEYNDLKKILTEEQDFSPAGSNFLTKVMKIRSVDQLVKFLRIDLDDFQDENMNQSFFPFGRSLQKPVSTQFNPFENPRHLVRGENSPYWTKYVGLIKDRIFCGHLEPKKAMECISYNDQAGRFEFQIVSDYAQNLQPKAYYVKRNICLSCHQNQAPIFPRFPWSESDDNMVFHSGLILSNLKNINPSEIQQRSGEVMVAINDRIKKRAAISRSEGADVNFNRTRAGRYDLAVNESNKILRFQKLWIHYCGNSAAGNACRANVVKFLIADSLSKTGRGNDILAFWVEQSRSLLSIQQAQAIPDKFIQERDAFLDPGQSDRDPLVSLLTDKTIDSKSVENCTVGVCSYEFLKSLTQNQKVWERIISAGNALPYSRDPKKFRPTRFEIGEKFAQHIQDSMRRFLTDDDLRLLANEYLNVYPNLGVIQGFLDLTGRLENQNKPGIYVALSGFIPGVGKGKQDLTGQYIFATEVSSHVLEPAVIVRSVFSAKNFLGEGSIKLKLNFLEENSFRPTEVVTPSGSYRLFCYLKPLSPRFMLPSSRSFVCSQYDPFHLFRLIDNLGESGAGSLGPSPFIRETFMRDFLAQIGSDKATDYNMGFQTPTPEIYDLSFVPQSYPQKSFYTYCSNCHSGEGPRPPNFMKADSEESFLKNLKTFAPKMKYQIESGNMPADRRKIPENEYQSMIKYLDSLIPAP